MMELCISRKPATSGGRQRLSGVFTRGAPEDIHCASSGRLRLLATTIVIIIGVIAILSLIFIGFHKTK